MKINGISFIAELDSYEDRVSEVQRLVDEQLPASNKKMLELLLCHLENTARKCDKNMMTISNLVSNNRVGPIHCSRVVVA